jgi:protein SCO1
MKPRLIAVIVSAVVLAGLAGWFAMEYTRSSSKLAEGPYGGPFELVTQDGSKITEAALRDGKPTVLFFGYTHCPDVCPTTLFELDGWLKQVDPDGDKLQAYFVSVDPERDTPEIMNQYVSNVSKRITGISGPVNKIGDMVREFHIYAKKVPIDPNAPDGDYTMDHTASVFLLDGGGRFSGTIAYGEDTDIAIKKLQNLIAG